VACGGVQVICHGGEFGEKTVHKSYERAPPEVTCFGGPLRDTSWKPA
jgi:hypothetical protein